FDAIVRSALRLLSGQTATLARVRADMLHLVALTTTASAADEAVRSSFPRPIAEHWSSHAQAVRDGVPVVVADLHTDPRIPPEGRAIARGRGIGSIISVPMRRDADVVGVISVARPEAGSFTNDEMALLETFADQAVIAIENVRLFKELQARTQELTRSVGEL